MPLVDLIRLFGSNILGIVVISGPKLLEKYPWKFRRFRDENWRGKVEL